MTQGPNRRLDSWKEIADYIGRDVRTAIRWEKEKGLPVHRVPGGVRQAVFTYSQEIDAWLAGQGPSGSNGHAEASANSATRPAAAAPRLTARTFAAMTLLAVAIGMAAYSWQGRPPGVAGSIPPRFLIGVLPFTNLSGDPEQEFLSDGLTEELITELGRLNPRQLGVIARASMMPYKKEGKSVREVAQELGLQYVLEGSVAREGSRLRVIVKLIQANDQTQVWADEYESDIGDLMQVKRNVARSVARETFVRVTPEAQKRLTGARPVSPQAYEAYLKGRFYWWMRTQDGYERARAYFEEALRIDPSFARAHAGLADVSTVYTLRLGDPRERARKAVELDDSLAEAHASLAMAVWSMEMDWTMAETHFRRALAIDPYYTTARHWYGFVLAHWGRHAEAIEQLEKARETDPLNVVVLADLGQAYFWAGQLERGKEPLHKAIAVAPAFHWSHYWLGRILEAQGDFEQALAQFELAEDQPPSRMDKNTAIACLYAKTGRAAKARALLRELENETAVHRELLPRNRALIYAALGDKDRAIEILNNPGNYPLRVVSAWVDPGFASLHSDPRFLKAIERVKPPSQ